MRINYTLNIALAAAALTAAMPAAAGTYTLGGSLTATDPTFNRTLDGNPPTGLSAVGTAVHFDTVSFTVDLSGSYVFLLNSGTGGFDTFLSLYSPSFNSASALTNVLQSNDDLNGLTTSGFTRTLAAGTSYIAVLTAFGNTDLGAYTFSINGPGNVLPAGAGGGVPEPASWAMMISGFGLVGGAMRRATPVRAHIQLG